MEVFARDAASLQFLFLVLASTAFLNGSCIGVNWGKLSSHPLPDDIIVDMILANGFKSVKLFDVDDGSLRALMGRDIDVMIAVPNLMLRDIAENPRRADDWVEANVTKYTKHGGVKIKLNGMSQPTGYVAVGNEPFLKDYNDRFLNVTLPALKNIQRALDVAELGSRIKATVPCNADVLISPGVPSTGNFRPGISDLMIQLLQFLSENKGPFTVNIYPFLDVYYNPHFPLDFAFFDGTASPMQDGDLTYTNVLDSSIDTVIWSMEKAGYRDIPIIIGEVGWPTDGDVNANIENARRFSQGLVRHVASHKGTPKRKGRLHMYMFSLLDEDMKSILPGNFERHWGIFEYDGKPKYQLNPRDSGDSSSKGLVGVEEVKYLARKWCVVNPEKVDNDNIKTLEAAMFYACQMVDCSALSYGSSCHRLSIEHGLCGNASYAFNQYYQAQNQQAAACVFSGLAMVTDKDPTNGPCVFPIMFASKWPTPNATDMNTFISNSPASGSDSTDGNSSAKVISSRKWKLLLGTLLVFLLASVI